MSFDPEDQLGKSGRAMSASEPGRQTFTAIAHAAKPVKLWYVGGQET
jgi:hypothetical protein